MRLTWQPVLSNNTYTHGCGRSVYLGLEIKRWRYKHNPKWKYSLEGFGDRVFTSLKAVIRAIGFSKLPSPGICGCGAKGSWLPKCMVYGLNKKGEVTAWSGCSNFKHRGVRLVPIPEDTYFQALSTGTIPEPITKKPTKEE